MKHTKQNEHELTCALFKKEHAGICDEKEYKKSELQIQRLIVIQM